MCLGGGRGRNADLCVCVWMIDEANCVLFRVKKKQKSIADIGGELKRWCVLSGERSCFGLNGTSVLLVIIVLIIRRH